MITYLKNQPRAAAQQVCAVRRNCVSLRRGNPAIEKPMTDPYTIYFDESGFTGHDLINPDQPTFTVASVDIEDAAARALLQASFPRHQAKEFKFTRVLRRPKNRGNLIRFAEHLAGIRDNIFVYICDKRFAAFAKTQDTLIEPVLHKRGLGFYSGGFGRRYVNTFHHAVMRHSSTTGLYDAIVSWYIQFSRNPSENELQVLRTIERSCPEPVKPFVSMLLMGAEFHCRSGSGSLTSDNDIHASCVLSSLYHWRTMTNREINIVHDDSSNFFRQLPLWNFITSSEVNPYTITYEEGRQVTFPLRVAQTRPGNSADSCSLQLCDMIAGLSAYLNRQPVDVDLRNDVLEARFGVLNADGVRPGTDFIDSPLSNLNGPDVLDQFIYAIGRRGS